MFSKSIPKKDSFGLFAQLTASSDNVDSLLKVAERNNLIAAEDAEVLNKCEKTTKLAALLALTKEAAPAKPMKAAQPPVPRAVGPSAPPPGIAAPKAPEPPVAGVSGAPITKTATMLGPLVPKALGLGAVSAGAYWGGKNAKEIAAQTANELSPEYSRRNAEQTAGRLGLMGGGLLGAGVAYGLGRPAIAAKIKGVLQRHGATEAQQDGLHLVGSALAGTGASMMAGYGIGGAVTKHKAEKLKDRQVIAPTVPPVAQVKTAGLFMRPSDLSMDNGGLASALERGINGSGQSKGFDKKAGVVDVVKAIAGNEHFIPTVAGAAIGAAYPVLKTTFGDPPKATPEPEDPETTFMGKTLAASNQFNKSMQKTMFEHPAQTALAGAVLGGVAGFKSTDAVESVKGLINRLRGTTGV